MVVVVKLFTVRPYSCTVTAELKDTVTPSTFKILIEVKD